MLRFINKFLSFILAFIIFFIIFISLLFLIIPQKKVSEISATKDVNSLESFVGFSRMRSPLKESTDGKNAVAVFNVWVEYERGDTHFYEELASKRDRLRVKMIEYFSERTQEELEALGEEEMKKELTSLLNAELMLNKIQHLYFSELIYLN